MPHQEIVVRTRDGECPTHVLTPSGTGPWPAVILYMDAAAIRPALIEMAAGMAEGGYLVLLPDLFYRFGHYEPLVPKKVFAMENPRDAFGPMMATTDARRAAADTESFIAYIETRRDVVGRKIGVTGYCMGGAIALTVAATYPERIAAAASFHGGNLATDAELSPHRLASNIKGRVYVAGADNDSHYPPEMAKRLEQALTDAGVKHKCEIYAGAAHGWTMTDFPIYDKAAAERHWRELFKLFGETLR